MQFAYTVCALRIFYTHFVHTFRTFLCLLCVSLRVLCMHSPRALRKIWVHVWHFAQTCVHFARIMRLLCASLRSLRNLYRFPLCAYFARALRSLFSAFTLFTSKFLSGNSVVGPRAGVISLISHNRLSFAGKSSVGCGCLKRAMVRPCQSFAEGGGPGKIPGHTRSHLQKEGFA